VCRIPESRDGAERAGDFRAQNGRQRIQRAGPSSLLDFAARVPASVLEAEKGAVAVTVIRKIDDYADADFSPVRIRSWRKKGFWADSSVR